MGSYTLDDWDPFFSTTACEIEGPPWPPPPTVEGLRGLLASFPPPLNDGAAALVMVGKLTLRIDEMQRRIEALEICVRDAQPGEKR